VGRVNAAQRRQLGVIRSAAISMAILAADVEELLRGTEYPLDGPPRPFSIRKVFDDVRRILGPLQEVKQIELHIRAPTGDAHYCLGHPAALRRVLLNLGMNALQATANGGMVIIAARRHGREQVEFQVSDNGPGFGTQSLAAGLGLKMCRDLLAALGSTLQMRTLPNGGLVRFTIDLPPAAVPPEVPA
ncbi:MAG TPA: HAMP domain-containing sensor histidine kinase, partial [Gemmatimonadales bacterium]